MVNFTDLHLLTDYSISSFSSKIQMLAFDSPFTTSASDALQRPSMYCILLEQQNTF